MGCLVSTRLVATPLPSGEGFTPPPTLQWISHPDPNGLFVWLFAYVFRFLLGVDFWNDVGDFPTVS